MGKTNFKLSMIRGLHVTRDDSDFSLRLGGRVYIDSAYYVEHKNDLGDNGIAMRTKSA